MSPLNTLAGTPVIAIVGGGFSGTALAIHLMRAARAPLRLVLVEPSAELGRGLAYGPATPRHLLNVPAGRMSLLPDRPDDFLAFLRENEPARDSGDFVPRRRYGDYVRRRLQDAIAEAGPVCFETVRGRVECLQRVADGRLELRVDGGRLVDADHVVLANGHFPPVIPAVLNSIADDPSFIADPWSPDALGRVANDAPVLLVGSGLTMIDLAMELDWRGHRGPLLAVSRHGLLPQPHRPKHSRRNVSAPAGLLEVPTLRHYMRTVRAAIRAHASEGIDWRDVMVALRPLTPELWARLPIVERARFLRHVRAYWDAHRHRCAPEVGRRLRQWRDGGRLRVIAGRLLEVRRDGAGFAVRLRPRWGGPLQSLRAGTIINCTGPAATLDGVRDPLLQGLLAKGAAVAGPLGLGIAIGDGYRVAGQFADRLHYLGPLLKGTYWEAIAVPELAVHAAALAAALFEAIRPQRSAA